MQGFNVDNYTVDDLKTLKGLFSKIRRYEFFDEISSASVTVDDVVNFTKDDDPLDKMIGLSFKVDKAFVNMETAMMGGDISQQNAAWDAFAARAKFFFQGVIDRFQTSFNNIVHRYSDRYQSNLEEWNKVAGAEFPNFIDGNNKTSFFHYWEVNDAIKEKLNQLNKEQTERVETVLETSDILVSDVTYEPEEEFEESLIYSLEEDTGEQELIGSIDNILVAVKARSEKLYVDDLDAYINSFDSDISSNQSHNPNGDDNKLRNDGRNHPGEDGLEL